MFNPTDTIPQGVYDDTLVIYSDNHIPYTYHLQVTITSNAVGNVLFDVLNELMEDVPNATITFQHQSLFELMYTVKTGADGTAMMYDIPEGRYTYTVSPPPGHSGYSGSFVISPGLATTVPIALEMNMVSVTWSVVPITIEDRYEIQVTQTFETNVPTSVLVTEPPSINLPKIQPVQVFNGEFTVTNYGLIAVDNVKLDFPTSFGDYDIEVLTSSIPAKINAMQKITVPYKITRRQAVAFDPMPQTPEDDMVRLFAEVRGYGGSGCLTSFNITTKGTAVICPNTPQQRTVDKYTTYTIAVPIDCPGGGAGGSGTGTYIPPSTTYYSGTSPLPPQPVGGATATNPTPITKDPCACSECPGGEWSCIASFTQGFAVLTGFQNADGQCTCNSNGRT